MYEPWLGTAAAAANACAYTLPRSLLCSASDADAGAASPEGVVCTAAAAAGSLRIGSTKDVYSSSGHCWCCSSRPLAALCGREFKARALGIDRACADQGRANMLSTSGSASASSWASAARRSRPAWPPRNCSDPSAPSCSSSSSPSLSSPSPSNGSSSGACAAARASCACRVRWRNCSAVAAMASAEPGAGAGAGATLTAAGDASAAAIAAACFDCAAREVAVERDPCAEPGGCIVAALPLKKDLPTRPNPSSAGAAAATSCCVLLAAAREALLTTTGEEILAAGAEPEDVVSGLAAAAAAAAVAASTAGVA